MADFENFESTGEPNAEEDPAADFLAREQTELAGLEDDTFNVEESSQPSDATAGNGFNAFEESTAPSDAQGEDASQVSEDIGIINPEPEIDSEPSQPSYFDNEEFPQMNGPTDGGGYAAIAQVDKNRQEPEKIRIWREEQKKRLEQKDAEEEVKNSQWREAAKKELEDWLKHHAEQLIKTKENNRHSTEMESDQAQEEASNKERDETIAGQEWEKICRLCDFNPKHSKNTKDVSRMRSILLQLKQTPLVR